MSEADPEIIARLRKPGNVRGLAPGLPMRGRIKAGRKGQVRTSQNGKEFQPPEKLPYFQITTLERGPDGNFKRDEAIHALLGEKPTEIPIQLLFDSIELNFNSIYGAYVGTRPWCLGNGEVALRQQVKDGPRDLQVQCPCERLEADYDKPDKCKIHGTLNCVIAGAPVIGGIWKFHTTSWNSVQGILSSLALIQSLTGGHLAGVPLRLVLRPKAVTTPKGQASTVYVAGIEFAGTISQLRDTTIKLIEHDQGYFARMQAVEQQARELQTAESQLGDDPDDDEEVAKEFHPEAVAEQINADNGATTIDATVSATAATVSSEVKQPPKINIDEVY